MPDYAFTSLSPRDFELLCRDLLQAAWGVRLESFATGPDGGIDLRGGLRRPGDLVVQCKHYAGSGYTALLRDLRKEVTKVRLLRPDRYVVATSLPLTPSNKDEIRALFHPYCVSASDDVLGRDDLNNLLGQRPEVESAHFKLWLTSERTLARIAAAGVVGESEAALARIRRRLQRFVPNESYPVAARLLDEYHAVVISGVPGIGKTTLAELLAVEYVDRHGYELVRISRDVAEVAAARRPGARQLFYFDDFLGATAEVGFDVNADRRLAELLEDVAASKHWRLVLTTREYILQAARRRSEVLSRAPLEKCTVDLAHYTAGMRAEILFNHLYFSDLHRDYARAVVRGRAYRRVVTHPNYNPRVVEHMTTPSNVRDVAPDAYVGAFLRALNDPVVVWRTAFAEQLSEAARHLVLILATLFEPAELGVVRRAFDAFYSMRQTRYRFATHSDDFRRALNDADGSFVRIERVGRDTVVSLRDPSIRDFVESHLAESPDDVCDLIAAAITFDQLMVLWRGRRGEAYSGAVSRPDDFAERLGTLFDSQSERRIRSIFGSVEVLWAEPITPEQRLRMMAGAAAQLRGPTMVRTLGLGVTAVKARVRDGATSLDDMHAVLRTAAAGQLPGEAPSETAAELPLLVRRQVAKQAEELDGLLEFVTAVKLLEEFPMLFDDSDAARIRARFVERLPGLARDLIDDYSKPTQAEELRDTGRELAGVAKSLAVDVQYQLDRIEEAATELGDRAGEDEDDESTISRAAAHRVGERDNAVDELFDRWRPELEATESDRPLRGGAQ